LIDWERLLLCLLLAIGIFLTLKAIVNIIEERIGKI